MKPARSDLLTLLSDVKRQRLPDLVERTLADKASVRRIAEISYRHDNGFTKLVVGATAQSRIRFHIWSTSQTSESNVHNHRWDFASMVLAGALHMEYFDIASGNVDPSRPEIVELEAFQYLPPSRQDCYELRRLGPVNAVRRSDIVADTGYLYQLAHDRLHRVTAPVTPAVTCFISAPAKTDHTTVLRHPAAPLEDGRVKRLTVAETRTELSMIRNLLSTP
ncbi:hypothetical protein ACWGE0_40850 [Lentzea sp. NPDC054927]